jgi:hypothetical protein
MERRLNASARFLDYGGRLQLVNSVLSSLPNHYLSSLKIHKTILKIADRSRRHCLWAKEEDSSFVHSLAAWSMVCRPKKKGGLGIINLEIQNQALLLKQLHKFYCKADTPWVKLVWSLYDPNKAPHAQSKRGSFWWKDVFSLSEIYRSISTSKPADGCSTLFWKDFWHSTDLLCDRFPRLFSYALDEDTTVARFLQFNSAEHLFALPLSTQAFEEYSNIQTIIQEVRLDASCSDSRIFCWGSSQYTSSKYYKFIFAAIPTDKILSSLWKSKCLPKLRVFAWLLIKDRLNTKELMQRKSWQIDGGPSCVLCNNQVIETRDHLFFDCPYARSCWHKLHITWDTSSSIEDRIIKACNDFTGTCFMEIFVCAAWNIWKDRNDIIFRNQSASLARWRIRFLSDLELHKYRVKAHLVQPLLNWIHSCVF